MERSEWNQVDDIDDLDPWSEPVFKPNDAEPLTARPNWWIAAAAGFGMLAMLFLVLLVLNRDSSPEFEPAGPIVEPTTTTAATTTTSATTTAVGASSPGVPITVSAVEIAVTGDPTACIGAAQTGQGSLEAFLNAALSQQGKPYEFGAVAAAADASPASFDTSELVKWSANRAGFQISDGSWLQYLALSDCGSTVGIEQALEIPGALVFGFSNEPTRDERPAESFVAISLGDGQRIIDVQQGQGVALYEASTRTLTHAAVIPDLGTGTATYLP